MPAFHYEDTKSIKDYLKSLDKFDRFETIELNTFVNLIEMSILSNEQLILREVFSTSFRQKGSIFFDDEFEKKVECLSAALEIQSRLAALKDFSISHIFFNRTWSTVQSENNLARYEVRVFNRENGFKIFVKVTFFERTEEIYSERIYCTDGKILDFSRLEEIVQKFDELDAVRTGK